MNPGAGTVAAGPGWRPFVDPLPLAAFTHWYAYLIPISFLIAMVYKAVRQRDLKGYWRNVAAMTVQIIGGMIALALASFLLIEVYLRWWMTRS